MTLSLPPTAPARRRATLSLAEIVQAAGRVLKREGYDALTMRRVAEELGVQAPSLYWYVKKKEELEDLLFDELVADLELTVTGGEWRVDLQQMAWQLRRHLLRKRDAGRILAGRFIVGPHVLRHLETAFGILRRAGLRERDAAYAWHTGIVFIHGFVIFETARLSATQADRTGREAALETVRQALAALPVASYPNIVALAGPLTTPDLEGRFQFGLDCIIAGIEKLANTDD
jgi:TetR/AcrR family transcriptional regulator, tetracycline repressor protein